MRYGSQNEISLKPGRGQEGTGIARLSAVGYQLSAKQLLKIPPPMFALGSGQGGQRRRGAMAKFVEKLRRWPKLRPRVLAIYVPKLVESAAYARTATVKCALVATRAPLLSSFHRLRADG
jgi:hypothetical protein